jgi:hypothetical protein
MKPYENLSLENIIYLDDNSIECIEIWRDLPDSEGMYQVSDLGRVKSFFKKKTTIKKQHFDNIGYLATGINKNKKIKTLRVHKLVAITFLNHIPNGYEIVVDHINNVKQDNRTINLQLISQRENSSKDKINKKCKYTGVNNSREKFQSFIRNNDKIINLGSFKTQEEASEYYHNAVKAIENGEEIVIKRQIYSNKYKNVLFNKASKKWRAYVNIDKNKKYIGLFNTEEEAFNFQQKYLLSIKNGVKIASKIKTKSSINKGISFNKASKKWRAYIRVDNKYKNIGYFNSEKVAYEYRENYLKK